MSGRGDGDKGSGRGDPKGLREGLRRNTRRSLKPANRRWVARRRLGEPTQTGPWPRASFPGRRQDPEAGTMEGGPTKQASSPGYFSGRLRPPKRPPDGDYPLNDDFGVNHGSPESSIEHRGEPPCDSMTDAEAPADERQFPVSEVDRGAHLGLIGGGRMNMGFEIFGLSVEGDGNRKSAAGKKLKHAVAIPESSRFCIKREVNRESVVKGKWKGTVAETKGARCSSLQRRSWILKQRRRGPRKKKKKKRDGPFQVLERGDLRINPFQEEENDGNQGTALKYLVQVPIGPVTRARAKKFKDVLNELIQELWAQANLWRPIEHDPRGQQRIVTLIQVLEESGQGQELARKQSQKI